MAGRADMSKVENRISGQIVDCAIEVHKWLGGPGLLESVYEEALVWELESRGLKVDRQKQVPVNYKGNKISAPMRLDLLVGDKVIVECKATSSPNYDLFRSQTLTYLRLSRLKLGLVINFGERRIIKGIRRVANGL